MTARWSWGLLCSSLLACGRAEGPVAEGRVLARVAGQGIGEEEFRAFAAKQPEWAGLKEKGGAQVREYLQTLVDRALLLREARAQGLDRRPDLIASLDLAFTQKLAQEVDRREVQSEVSVSEEEVKECFTADHWDRKLKVAHIFVRSRERAEEVLAALGRGEPFAAVAERLSEDPPSAARGGEMPYYYGRANAAKEVRDALFRLELGKVSGLVPIAKGYEIFKVLDVRQVEFDKVAGKVRQELIHERLAARGKARFAELAAQARLEPDPRGLGRLVALLLQGPQDGRFVLPAVDLELPLYRDRAGAVTLGQAIEQSGTIRQGRGLDDSLEVVEVLHAEVLAPRILAQRGRQLKLDADPQLVAWRQRREEDLLITTLRQQVVAAAVVSEEEARSYYQANQERYRNPQSTEVVEVLLSSEEEAREALAQIEAERPRLGPLVEVLSAAASALPDRIAAGKRLDQVVSLPVGAGEPAALPWLRRKATQPRARAELLDDLARAQSPAVLAEEYLFRHLAAERSQRVDSGKLEGHYRLHWFEEARFGNLVEQAMGAPIGAVLGPVPVDSLYAIAVVIGRQGAQVRPFEEVRRPLRARLQEERRNEVFARWLEELRRTRKGEVEYLEEQIEALGKVLSQEPPPAAGGKG